VVGRHHDEADRGIEMGAGDRREDGDGDEQDRTGGKRVAQKRDGLITAGKLRCHDSRADHRHHQNEGAERFRRQAAGQIEVHSPPVSASAAAA